MSGGLRRDVGFLQLLFVSITGVIGSGWLFAAMYSAQDAGPAAVLSWCIGGGVCLMIALAYAELSGFVPVAGGLGRYPHLSHGGLASFVGTWLVWLGYVAAGPIEVVAVLEYLDDIWPWLVESGAGGKVLTPAGIGFAVVLLAVFTAINWFGVAWMAKSNVAITWWKLVVPVVTAVTLIAVAFRPERFTEFGFAPGGMDGVFAAVASGGVIFSLLGFRAAIEMAGEARDPQRTVPRVLVLAVLVTTAIYILLQVAFIGAVPDADLSQGWAHVAEKAPAGPFYAFALKLGLGWLAVVLLADAVISPGGSALMYLGASARVVFAAAANRNAPRFGQRLNRYGVPGLALLFNFGVGLVILLPLPGWQELVSMMSSATIVGASFGIVTVHCLRIQHPDRERRFRLPGAPLFCLITFVLCTLIASWSGWSSLSVVLGAVALGLIVLPFGLAANPEHRDQFGPRHGVWTLVYLAGLGVLAWLGPYSGGRALLAEPWASLAVAAFAAVVYPVAVRMRHPDAMARRLVDGIVEEAGLD